MPDPDLMRVKRDLETVEDALGLRRDDVGARLRIGVLFAAAGLAAAAWAFGARPDLRPLGLCAFGAPVIEWLRVAAASPARDRFGAKDLRGALGTLWLAMPLLGLFLWCRHAGLGSHVFLGLATFLVGTVVFSSAVGGRTDRDLLAWSVPLMAAGLVVSAAAPAAAVAVLAAAIACGGAASAALALLGRTRPDGHGTH